MEYFEIEGCRRSDNKPFPEGCYWAPHVPCVYHAAKQDCPWCGPWRKMYQPWLARTWLALAILNAVVFVCAVINLACGPDNVGAFLSIFINGSCGVWCWRNYLRQNMRYYTNALDAIASLDDGGGQ